MSSTHIQDLVDEARRVLGSRPQNPTACIAALERAVAACREDQSGVDPWVEPELLDDLVDCYEAVGRFDAAIAAMRRAVEVGWRGRPDGRCRIAELLMQSGRGEEARQIWQQVLADTPEDVWLFNNAGMEYAAVGEHREALTWLNRGLELAMASGDEEQLVGQLLDLRTESLDALGEPTDDEITARAIAFLADPPSRPLRHPAAVPSRPSVLSATRPPPETTPVAPRARRVRLALAWFPADEFPRALELWPELTEEGAAAGAADHSEYSRALERTLRLYDQAEEIRLCIAPIRIDAYLDWCADHDEDPAAGSTRASYSADLAQDFSSVVAWPPGRNQPCWCGSGRKYKVCCGRAQP